MELIDTFSIKTPVVVVVVVVGGDNGLGKFKHLIRPAPPRPAPPRQSPARISYQRGGSFWQINAPEVNVNVGAALALVLVSLIKNTIAGGEELQVPGTKTKKPRQLQRSKSPHPQIGNTERVKDLHNSTMGKWDLETETEKAG